MGSEAAESFTESADVTRTVAASIFGSGKRRSSSEREKLFAW